MKDHLFIMSKTNASDMAICEVMSIKNNMSEKRTTKFVVSKSAHYKRFVVKKRTLQPFPVDGLDQYL